MLSFEVQNLIAQLISEKNSRFSNIYDIFSHPWLESINFKKLFSKKGPVDVTLSSEFDLKFFEQYTLNELYNWEKEKIEHIVSPDIVRYFMSFNLLSNFTQPFSKLLSGYNSDNHFTNRFVNKTSVPKKLSNFSLTKSQMREKDSRKSKFHFGYRDFLLSQLMDSQTLENKTLKNDLFRKMPDVFTFCDNQEQNCNSSSVDAESSQGVLSSNSTVINMTSAPTSKTNVSANLENINHTSLTNKFSVSMCHKSYDSELFNQNINNLIKKMQENKIKRNLKF